MLNGTLWLKMVMGCVATGCVAGDVLRVEVLRNRVLRLRDGAEIPPNAGKLALALAQGWVVPIPSRLRSLSA